MKRNTVLERELLNEKEEDFFEREDWDCPECEFKGEPKVSTFNEGTDADGRRGQLVTYITCPECEFEEVI